MRKLIYILMFLVLISLVSAEKVMLLDFNYDDGSLSLNKQVVKDGFYPDRVIQEGDYEILILKDVQELYSFNFEIPNLVYSDISYADRVEGGVEELSEINFTLIVPYFSEADRVLVSYEGDELLEVDIEEKGDNKFVVYFVIGFILIVLILGYIFLRKFREKQ